jgi:predicted PurR-regulated permease PerM
LARGTEEWPIVAERIVLWVLLGGLAAGCTLVLLPFVSALLWAGILVFSTWPVFEWLRRRARLGRHGAALVMVLLTAVVVVVPLVLVAPESEASASRLRAAALHWLAAGLPPAPHWLAALPLAGPSLAEIWDRWAADFSAALAALQPYFGVALGELLRLLLGIVGGVAMFLFALFIAFFLYLHGEPIAAQLHRLLGRIGGARGERLLALTGLTVRGVVYGLLGTAVVQGVLVGFGLWLVGVPRPMLFGAVAGFLSLLPIGAPVVWVPVALWLLAEGAVASGLFLGAWGTLIVSSADNLIRPWFISRGAELPYLISVLGVLGGALSFGLLGIFLGPVLLGVGYTLIIGWSGDADPAAPADPSAASLPKPEPP